MTMSKLVKSKTERSLLEKAFAEIMPEVKFVDVALKVSDIAVRTRRSIKKQTGKKVISKDNFKNQKFLKGSNKK